MPYFTQPEPTARIMELIRAYRGAQGIGIEQLTLSLSELHPEFPLTYFEYRAMESGQTKNVPVHVVLGAATFLGIPAHELFPELDA